MRTFSPFEISNSNVQTHPFTGEWFKIFEEPDVRFSTIIRGEAKAGKSTYAYKFAQYVSQFGRILYISSEENVKSKTVKNRLEYCGVTSEKIRFIYTKNVDDVESLIKTGGYRFVIIDSVQSLGMNFETFKYLKDKFRKRKLSWHLIMQMGVNITQWKHEVDVLVRLSQGLAHVDGRYNASDCIRILKSKNQQQTLF
jgi:adenosyl cobinamide kinase/adenosyl cobinamide phosphate guanylyltransferase